MRSCWRYVLLAALSIGTTRADQLQIAVAANFLGTLQQLAPEFEKASGHKLLLSGGASGQIYAQLSQGAPFDIFLSADAERPKKLVDDGLAIPDSRFTYAIGRLVLWSPKVGAVDEQGAVLQRGKFQFLAIANPKVAPYGAAAQQVLAKLNLWDKFNADKKIVTGESISQTLQFVTSGNAEIAFLAWSQVIGDGKQAAGSSWFPPPTLYDPISQDAVILKRTQHAVAAAQFMRWLRTDPQALATIIAAGYTVN